MKSKFDLKTQVLLTFATLIEAIKEDRVIVGICQSDAGKVPVLIVQSELGSDPIATLLPPNAKDLFDPPSLDETYSVTDATSAVSSLIENLIPGFSKMDDDEKSEKISDVVASIISDGILKLPEEDEQEGSESETTDDVLKINTKKSDMVN